MAIRIPTVHLKVKSHTEDCCLNYPKHTGISVRRPRTAGHRSPQTASSGTSTAGCYGPRKPWARRQHRPIRRKEQGSSAWQVFWPLYCPDNCAVSAECRGFWGSGQDCLSGLSPVTLRPGQMAGGRARHENSGDETAGEIVIAATAAFCMALTQFATSFFVAFSGIFILIFFGLCSSGMSGTSCLSESAMVVYGCIKGLSTLEFWRSV